MRSSWRCGLVAAALALSLGLAACSGATPQGAGQQQPREGKAGLRITGTVDGRQIAVLDGSPRLVRGNCDPARGPTDDLCFVSRRIDGEVFVLVFRNPDALEAQLGAGRVPIAAPPCPTVEACEQITDEVLVDVQIGDARQRVTGGSVAVTALEPGQRYAGTVRLNLPDGQLDGSFDVVPREG